MVPTEGVGFQSFLANTFLAERFPTRLLTGRFQVYEIIGGELEMPIMVYALTSATWTIAAIATLSNVRPHVLRCLQESTCPLNNTLGGDRGSDHLLPLGLIIPNIAALATLATRAFTY